MKKRSDGTFLLHIYEALNDIVSYTSDGTSEDQFPKEFKDYIKFLEAQLETPIRIISIGPDRDQTIVRK